MKLKRRVLLWLRVRFMYMANFFNGLSDKCYWAAKNAKKEGENNGSK